MTKSFLFESATCSRCGGCGQHSYCQQYGSTCFKCHGDGVVLTKRGMAAQTYFNAICEVPADLVAVGTTIRIDDISPAGRCVYFAKVIEISEPYVYGRSLRNGEWHDNIGVKITTNHAKRGLYSLVTSPDSKIRVAQTKGEKARKREIALAYQANLTKQGTTRKRKANKETDR